MTVKTQLVLRQAACQADIDGLLPKSGTLSSTICVPKGTTMQVGIRELRDRLKHYVAAARSGEDVIITDRGHAVARLVALHEERPVDRLIKAGLATPPRRPKGGVDWKLVPSEGSVSDLIER
jgi:prevent-host-death family protein